MQIKISENRKSTLIFDYIKQELHKIIQNNDENLLNNYLQFLKELFKKLKSSDTYLLNPNDFYQNTLKPLLVINESSIKSLVFALEV